MKQQELQKLIDEIGIEQIEGALKDLKRNRLTNQNVFKDLNLRTSNEIDELNERYGMEETKATVSRHTKKPKSYFDGKDLTWRYGAKNKEVYPGDIHEILRKLVMSLFGEVNGKDLDEDELGLARQAYYELKQTYLSLYEVRLRDLER